MVRHQRHITPAQAVSAVALKQATTTMKMLELKVPPVAVFLLCGAGMWVLASLTSALSVTIPARQWLAIAAAGAGIAMGVAGIAAFRAAMTTVDPRFPEKSSNVVRAGIYRRTRNPMYLGLLLVLLGWAIYLAHALSFIGLPVFVLYMNRFQIVPEEQALTVNFGREYRDYKAHVRRWI